MIGAIEKHVEIMIVVRRGRVVTVCLNLLVQTYKVRYPQTPLKRFELRFQGLGVATGIHLQLYRQCELERARLTAESANAFAVQVQSSLRTKDTLGTGILSSFRRLSLSRRLAIV